MKKYLLLLITVFAFFLSGCGKDETTEPVQDDLTGTWLAVHEKFTFQNADGTPFTRSGVKDYEDNNPDFRIIITPTMIMSETDGTYTLSSNGGKKYVNAVSDGDKYDYEYTKSGNTMVWTIVDTNVEIDVAGSATPVLVPKVITATTFQKQ